MLMRRDGVPGDAGSMSLLLRTIFDIVLRAAVLVAITEGAAALYAQSNPDDDGLGTGLTAMFVLVAAAGLWGIWDGFRRRPLRLCTTWVVTGLIVSVATTVVSNTMGDEAFDRSVFIADLRSGLLFWAALVFVPAIAGGIVQSALASSASDAR